mmetsp:Transcript_88974/g.229555  ORF Transcript_88974/g.229555 Transcript_88974/m.229555 type:complete len:201 (+) Transcript_88974:444-1046(+)
MMTSLLFFSIIPILMIQGIGSPTRISKMLEPMDEEMAMSPKPSLATAMEETASGMDVPAARTVTGRMRVSPGTRMPPRISTHQTRKKEKKPIQNRDRPKVAMNHLGAGSGLGIVYTSTTYTGHESTNTTLSQVLPSAGHSSRFVSSSSSVSSALSCFTSSSDSPLRACSTPPVSPSGRLPTAASQPPVLPSAVRSSSRNT